MPEEDTGGSSGKLVRAPDTRVCIEVPFTKSLVAHSLVDTGACRTLIREDFWRKLCRALHRQPIFKEAEPLCSLTGHRINTIGRTLVELLGEYLEVTIVKRMNHDLLLGDDCLRELGAVIDYSTGKVHLQGRDFLSHTLKGGTSGLLWLRLRNGQSCARMFSPWKEHQTAECPLLRWG